MIDGSRRGRFPFGPRRLLALTTLFAVAVGCSWPAVSRHLFPAQPCPSCGYGPGWPEHSPFCMISRSDTTYFAPGPEFKLSRVPAAQMSIDEEREGSDSAAATAMP